GSFSVTPGTVSDADSVRIFLPFLQRAVEMGKTSAGMCIERIAPARHNEQHQVAFCATTIFYPLQGTSHEQL
ncbi:hypothetical protein OSL45_25900, partial [Escherichia coli]|nr:hypothetical protein [Escherichia coli]